MVSWEKAVISYGPSLDGFAGSTQISTFVEMMLELNANDMTGAVIKSRILLCVYPCFLGDTNKSLSMS